MDAFKEIEENWEQQGINQPNESSYENIVTAIKQTSKNYKGNQSILIVTAVILVVFALAVSGFTTLVTAIGFSLMIGCLILRIAFEAIHNYKLRHLDISRSSKEVKETLLNHYNQRKWVHYVLTPLCLIMYGYGFYMLLPAFKASLSEGFYSYILISGAIVFIFLIILIRFVIKKEIKQHKQMQQYFE